MIQKADKREKVVLINTRNEIKTCTCNLENKKNKLDHEIKIKNTAMIKNEMENLGQVHWTLRAAKIKQNICYIPEHLLFYGLQQIQKLFETFAPYSQLLSPFWVYQLFFKKNPAKLCNSKISNNSQFLLKLEEYITFLKHLFTSVDIKSLYTNINHEEEAAFEIRLGTR